MPYLSREDEARLARQAQAGDRQASEKLYESVRYPIRGMCLHLAKRTGLDIEELYQEAGVSYAEILLRFDPERGRLITILGKSLPPTVLRRCMRAVSREKQQDNHAIDTHAYASDEESVEIAARSEHARRLSDRLRSAAAKLTSEEREVLQALLAGETAAAYARRQGFSRQNGAMWYAKVRAKLATLLAGLPESHAEVVGAVLAGRTPQDFAARQGCSPSSALARMRRVNSILKTELALLYDL